MIGANIAQNMSATYMSATYIPSMHDREPNSAQRTGKEGSVLKGGKWSLNYGSERTTFQESHQAMKG